MPVCLLGMSSILSKSRFSRNIKIQVCLMLLRPPCARIIPSNSRNYSQGVDADSVKNSKNISKIAIWSSIGVCSVAFFAFQTGYFHKIIDKTSHFRQIIDKKGYSDKIIDTNHHVSGKFVNKDNTDPISVDVASRDRVKPHGKFREDSDSLALDSDSVSSSSEGKFIGRKFEKDSVGGEDSDLLESLVDSSDGSDIEDGEITIMPSPHLHVNVEDTQQENTGRDGNELNSFMDEYCLREGEKGTTDSNLKVDKKEPVLEIKEMEGVVNNSEEKWVIGFIEAIHAAEKRQADLDAQAFHKEKEILKDRYQNALADSKAKELMYAEEVEILDKELFHEKVRAEEAMKVCRDEAEAKFKVEAEQKEREAELKMKRLVELGKAELIGAVISEKTSQLKKIEEASLHINSLSVAFHAQNTEAQQTQSVHKLALLAQAVEDSFLSNGLLLVKEDVDATCHFMEGRDTVVDLVMSSLSKDVCSYGTHDLSHLHQKLEGLKRILRLHNLIPHGGGGFLTHSVARMASLLKVKEKDVTGDGIESAMNKAERLLLQGKLCEAADTMEEATRDSQAAGVIMEWVKCVRNRAIIEQAVAFLKSYAASISLHNM